MTVIEVTETNFEQEVLKSEKTVLVDFWAEWCGPCKMMSPIVDQVADEQSEVKVCKVNVDDNLNLARKYNVMSIPTLMIFRNGESVATSEGLISKSDVLQFITQ